MIGPVLGSMVYSSLGYENTFFFFSALLLVSCVFVFFILPARLNKLDADQIEEDNEKQSTSQIQGKEITFMMFLKNGRAMLAVFSSMIAMVFMLFYNGILANELTGPMGVSPDYVGYIFALGALMYALSSPLVSIVFKGIPRRYITQLAFLVSSVALFLFGPSKMLGFNE
jgi:predicted MFS family arabinose efflux permease